MKGLVETLVFDSVMFGPGKAVYVKREGCKSRYCLVVDNSGLCLEIAYFRGDKFVHDYISIDSVVNGGVYIEPLEPNKK